MTQTIINLGTGGAALNGQNGSTAGADSNDALFLDWPGDNAGNYVYLPGVASNNMSVPDEAALDITGDIDIRVRVALDDWTPASFHSLLAKTASANVSYGLGVLSSTGALRFFWSTDGTSVLQADSTVSPTISDFSVLWVRVTLDVDNGASGRDVRFFTSDDGLTWTQLGTTVTQAGVTSIYAGTAIVSIGFHAGGTESAGKFYRAQVLNGINGTKVLDVDTAVITTGAATSFTALTGQTVTINRSTAGRKSVSVVSSCWLFGTDDYMEVADNDLLDFGATDSFTVVAVVRQWATQPSFFRYLTKANNVDVGYSIIHSNTATGATFFLDDGPNFISGNLTLSLGVISTVAGVVNRSAQTLTTYTNSTAASPVSIASLGSLSNSLPFRIGADSAGLGSHTNMELLAVAVFRRALSAAEISAITSYYQARLS